MAFYGPRGGEVGGGATWPGGKRHAWGELRERMAHLEGLLEGLREANTGLSEVALKLRRALTPKAPALNAAIKAERETFRIKRELQRLDIVDLEQVKGRAALPEVRRGGKVVDVEQLLQQKVQHDEPD